MMATRPPTLLDAWHTWNFYHRQVLKDFPRDTVGKVAIRVFRKRISDDWKSIGVLHPNTHGVRKVRFHKAVERLRFVTEQYRRASERLSAEINRGVLGEPETHEHLMNAQIVKLQVLQANVNAERLDLGPPADRIRGYDRRRAIALMREFQVTGQQAAIARDQHEQAIGNIPPRQDGRGRREYGPRYQRRVQQRNVDPHPGGKMFYHHLFTSSQTTAGVWIRTDAHNQVVDRVAVKDAYFITTFDQWWTNPAKWFGDVLNPTTKEPWEVRIHRNLPDHENILRFRSWHMHPAKLMYRVSFCNGCLLVILIR